MIALLALSPGDVVLDVPVGAGPIAVPLARRGIEVTGVDLSAERIAEAQAAAEAAGVSLALHEHDMRELPWDGRFDAAINCWGSFGYFGDEGDESFARAVCATLKPGGRFLIEIPSLETIAVTWDAGGTSVEGDIEITEARTYDFVTGFVDDAWTFRRGEQVDDGRTIIRMYSVAELARLLQRAGFCACTSYGSLDGRPFEFGARLNMVATK